MENENEKSIAPDSSSPVTATKKPRGFAALALTPEGRAKISEIARKGGKAAHEKGTAHEFSSEEARVAGVKGGKATHAKLRALKNGG